jgi:GT2 family glycosyltransferase
MTTPHEINPTINGQQTDVAQFDTETPLVSVVIVTWNRKEDVLAAVASVYAQTYRPVEIVVVDNGSTDGTVAALQTDFPAITLITLDHNAGITTGRNLGIQAAQGEFIFILDSDATLNPDTLDSVVTKFRVDPAVGIISCKILHVSTGALDEQTWIFTECCKARQDEPFFCFSFCECGAAFRREVFEQAGLFWDFLFFGREGEDLSIRAWDAGFKVLYWPQATVTHHVSLKRRVAGGEREYYDFRNALYIYLVRYPWWILVWLGPLRTGFTLLKAARRRWIGDALRALRDVVRHLPYLMQQRQPISSRCARHYLHLLREHGALGWDIMSWLRQKTERAA